MNSYNGYTGREREAKLRALHRLELEGTAPTSSAQCMLCGDSDTAVILMPHSEDYSQPFLWTAPAMYWLCRHCHLAKLHMRFLRPNAWRAFLLHVRRGGFASDLKVPAIRREFRGAMKEFGEGKSPTLSVVREREFDGQPWWEQLTLDPLSLNTPRFRPRP
jgi:hypothetical protein